MEDSELPKHFSAEGELAFFESNPKLEKQLPPIYWYPRPSFTKISPLQE